MLGPEGKISSITAAGRRMRNQVKDVMLSEIDVAAQGG
jgi:hypothetical protein